MCQKVKGVEHNVVMLLRCCYSNSVDKVVVDKQAHMTTPLLTLLDLLVTLNVLLKALVIIWKVEWKELELWFWFWFWSV